VGELAGVGVAGWRQRRLAFLSLCVSSFAQPTMEKADGLLH
jgi:hypothetical protein